MKKVSFICLALFILVVFVIYKNNSMTIKEKIDNQNYIILRIPSNENKYYTDLKAKLSYGGSGVARNGNMYYPTSGHPYTSEIYGFNKFKYATLLYPIIADKTTVAEVKRANYVVEKKITNKKHVELIEDSGYIGTKARIYYNHQCLPVKIQFMDWETKKWVTDNRYDYYDSTPKEYKQKWEDYVKLIKEGEFRTE